GGGADTTATDIICPMYARVERDQAALAAQIADHDLVLDCTDNVAIRNQLNVGCFQHKTPLVSGAAIRMEGQISSISTTARCSRWWTPFAAAAAL
ncbi:ThiF family adenylyltransferase, partial [Klebsiella pneumoniae]|uniref:ThiF family adenylyltransferase n=1 Tax=Klebsiella pneumoniae TaxID=573 RepID=UPI00210CB159